MTSRRCFLLQTAAVFLASGRGAIAQSLVDSRPEDILIVFGEKLRDVAQNAGLHELYSALAFAQLQFRISTNFNGYESFDSFYGPARAAMSEVLFDEKSRAQVIAEGANFNALKSNLDRLASAYEFEKTRFLEFSERLAKDALELGLPAPAPDLLLAGLAYYTVFAVSVRESQFSSWFDGSWVWPFCFRQ